MKTSTRVKAISLALIVLAALIGPGLSQGASDHEGFVNPKDIKWGDAPPSLPKGAKIAVLQGDPGKPGPFVIRLARASLRRSIPVRFAYRTRTRQSRSVVTFRPSHTSRRYARSSRLGRETEPHPRRSDV